MFRISLAMLCLAAMPAAATAAPACAPLPGLTPLLKPATRIVLFGEYHGTVEMPGIVADALCSAVATERPVTLGIELPRATQPFLDAYLRSNGRAQARATLLAAPAWAEAGGRTSQAILDLIDTARRLVHAGRDVRIVAFDPVATVQGTSAEREAGMARLLTEAQATHPDMLVVALTGSGHADRGGWSSRTPPFASAGQLLSREQSLVLTFARPGGAFWGCQPADATPADGCKAYPMPVREPVRSRGVTLDATIRAGFDGIYSAGSAYTASRPAAARTD